MGKRIFLVFCLVSALTLATGQAWAAVTPVDCANENLQDAIDDASAGDTLLISGVCTNPGGLVSFTIDKELSLVGSPNATLDGDSSSTVIVVEDATVVLEGLSVQNGSGAGGIAGGIQQQGTGTLTLHHANVVNNSSQVGPGGIAAQSNLTLTHSEVSGNVGGNVGGISASGNATYDIRSSTISGNEAKGTPTGIGGIEVFGGATMTVRNSRILANTAFGSGIGSSIGGLSIGGATTAVTIIRTLINANQATGIGATNVGGVNHVAGSLTLHTTLVAFNTAGAGATTTIAGGIRSLPGTPVLLRTRVLRNDPNNCVGFNAPGCLPA